MPKEIHHKKIIPTNSKAKLRLFLKVSLVFLGLLLIFLGFFGYKSYVLNEKLTSTQIYYQESLNNGNQLSSLSNSLKAQLASVSAELNALKAVDQKLRNDRLEATISAIEKTFGQVSNTYENLVKLREKTDKTEKYDDQFTKSLVYLQKRNYASASANLVTLNKKINSELVRIQNTFSIPKNITSSNTPPTNGFSSQRVSTEIGEYLVYLIAGNLSSTRVIVDTASDSTCTNNCPVTSLADYVSRNHGYAGINGSYFCPASYPSCSGKTNSFDTLLMNKNKVYFNSDNNVYSNVPAVIFGGGWVRFVGRSLDWGRDTGIDSMIANQPLVVSGGNNVFSGDGDPKKGSKGTRSFVANKGNTVYIGTVFNSTVAEMGYVLKTLGMDNALNLDSGGSTALWYSGYKVGPGRNIPNAIVFVRK